MAVFFCYRSSALVCSIILAVTLGKGLSATDHPSLCDKNSEESCDIDKVAQWIEQGAEVDCLYHQSRETFLMRTLWHCTDTPQLTKLLLEHNASVTKVSRSGWTALFQAVEEGNIKSAELILEHGGSVHHHDDRGYTPLRLALEGGSEGMKQLLLRHGALEGCTEWTKKLVLAHGAWIDEPNDSGRTLLMQLIFIHAGIRRDADCLLQAGADPFARDAAGLTARDMACAMGNTELCRSLPQASGAEQWRRLSTSRPFWMVFASSALIAIVTYCWPVSSPPPPLGEAAPFSRESVLVEQAEGRYSRGSVLLAVRASYTSARTTGALMFRVLEVYATVVLPMFVMQAVQPMMFLPVFLAMCAPNLLARRISSCGTVNLSNLLVSVPRSLLIIQQWSGKDALVCVCGFIRVMVVGGLFTYIIGGYELHLSIYSRVYADYMFAGIIYDSEAGRGVAVSVPHPQSPLYNYHGLEATRLLYYNGLNEFCIVPMGPCFRVGEVFAMWDNLMITSLVALALYCLSVLGLTIVVTIVAVLSLCVGGGSFQPLAPNSAQAQDLAARIESLCCSRTDQDLRQDIGKLQGSVKRVAPLESCTCCPPGGVYFTVAFVAVDVILDAIMVYNLLMNEDFYFAGIILGTSTFSTVRELRSRSFRSLPSEVIESVRTGKWSTGLLDVLDSERGTEAVISLMVNSYAFVYICKTPAKFLTSLLSLSTSTLSCASYVHEHFDLEGAMGEDH